MPRGSCVEWCLFGFQKAIQISSYPRTVQFPTSSSVSVALQALQLLPSILRSYGKLPLKPPIQTIIDRYEVITMPIVSSLPTQCYSHCHPRAPSQVKQRKQQQRHCSHLYHEKASYTPSFHPIQSISLTHSLSFFTPPGFHEVTPPP